MPNLQTLDISNNPHIGPGGAVHLLESLCSLKQLECLKTTGTNIGCLDAQALIKLIAVSNTPQILHVSNPTIVLWPSSVRQGTETMTHNHEEFMCKLWVQDSILKEIIPTALAIRTLELYRVTRADVMQLSSLLPFNSSITTLTLHNIGLDSLAYLTPALYASESLTSLNIVLQYINQEYDKFSREEVIVLLNDALQHNIHCRHLKLSTTFLFPFIHDLAYQLRRGPTGPQLKLKRAHSLPCLKLTEWPDCDKMLFLEHRFIAKSKVFDSSLPLRRCSSALDLTLIKSISSLHPSLTDSLNISEFCCGHVVDKVDGASKRLLQMDDRACLKHFFKLPTDHHSPSTDLLQYLYQLKLFT